jgi:phospholipid/cholesterol/gamma-HCH transport system substrate-binding protein
MKKLLSKEFKIGLITIICAAILVFGIDYLKGINILKPENYFYARYGSVAGLDISSPVYLDGFKVGLVRSIEYDYAHPGNVIVELSLDKQLKVPSGSKAILATDLLGTASIDLKLNTYVSAMHVAGDTLEGGVDAGLMGNVTQNMLPQVEQMLPKLDSILTGLQTLLAEGRLKETLINVNEMTAELNTTSRNLNKMMKGDVPAILGNLKTTTSNLAKLSDNAKDIDVDALAKSVERTLANVEEITKQLNSTDNSLGLLLNSDGVYRNLNNTLAHADSLMIDLKANPKRYVHFSIFGRK